jgi:hypothetical protein
MSCGIYQRLINLVHCEIWCVEDEKPRRRYAGLHVRDAENGRLRASGRSPREEGIIVRACQPISMVIAYSRTLVLEF